jgi:hypothetical protein
LHALLAKAQAQALISQKDMGGTQLTFGNSNALTMQNYGLKGGEFLERLAY